MQGYGCVLRGPQAFGFSFQPCTPQKAYLKTYSKPIGHKGNSGHATWQFFCRGGSAQTHLSGLSHAHRFHGNSKSMGSGRASGSLSTKTVGWKPAIFGLCLTCRPAFGRVVARCAGHMCVAALDGVVTHVGPQYMPHMESFPHQAGGVPQYS